MPRRLVVLALTVCACATAPQTITSRSAGTLLFGIATPTGTQEGKAEAAALETALTQRLGKPVVVMAFGDESSLADALANGAIDAAWMPPLAFMEARSHAEITPIGKLIRHGSDHYRSVIFARADSKLSALSELRGKRMAWVDRRSASGYSFPRALFLQAHLDPAKLFGQESFEGDHAAVCRAVLEGRADAGATFADDQPDGVLQIDGCVRSVGAAAAARLVVISVSKPIPNDVVAVRVGCPEDTVAALKTVLVDLGSDADGKALLSSVFQADAFAAATAREFGLGAE